ncbi:hypothetical protein BFJ63_vAg19850 [Fusarium oxysporum f. sp. narcissi]|uniref:Uncharacterized protein n=1 Tax=Fusarium oxysporum f. sp. narcissi TaxID=451672 RepID=A0A4V1RX90_FUSOX|nr:hypothetical protein BFJ63_vAg19850 [Fusarium oxysporum f. sp. narcissi]
MEPATPLMNDETETLSRMTPVEAFLATPASSVRSETPQRSRTSIPLAVFPRPCMVTTCSRYIILGMGFWVRYSESQWQPPMGLQTLYPKQEPKTKKLRRKGHPERERSFIQRSWNMGSC